MTVTREDNTLKSAGWLCALGVVYGDIGTSPIYALGACLKAFPKLGISEVLGIVSLILWVLVLIVSVKYVMFVMRADNRGEGGIFALISSIKEKPWQISLSTKLLLLGAGLLYGDGIITPAISVISAVEGVKTIDPAFAPLIVPVSLVILGALFFIQKKGSKKVGSFFGPIMLLWFAVLAILGATSIASNPDVLKACNPYWAYWIIQAHPWHSIFLLGAVILAYTGTEALYADMGHFGRPAIVKAWHYVVFPATVINYLGQGALVLSNLENSVVLETPFFSLVPAGFYSAALTLLSSVATVIASQAMISGIFSLTSQAMRLGFFPRLNVVHTSEQVEGQIYIPFINSVLAVSVFFLVIFFQSSEALVQAYGTSVAGTMLLTTIGFFKYCQKNWKMNVGPIPFYLVVVPLFFVIDALFLGANLFKFFHGGYIPLGIGAAMYTLMYVWKKGRLLSAQKIFKSACSVEYFLKTLDPKLPRVPGIAVFMSATSDFVPTVLLRHIKYCKVYYENMVLMTVITEDVPRATADPSLEHLGNGVYRIVARVGYMEEVNVPLLIQKAVNHTFLSWDINQMIYYFNHDLAFAGESGAFWGWQKRFFSFILRLSRPAYYSFKVPPSQIVEMGVPVEL